MKQVKVGDHVIWHEADSSPFNAVVTTVWSETCINLVFVSGDETKRDSYGRQIERRTSCSYKDLMNVHGYYWRFVEDEPNPFIPPQQV